MFKRVTKRAKRREWAEELGLADEMQELEDTDSDESDSDEDEGSPDERETEDGANYKKNIVNEEEGLTGATDEGVSDEQEIAALSSMTVREALKSSIEDTSCIICPGKNLKNAQMENVHLQSSHHQRRLRRFKAMVERLSSQFEDIYTDQAALVVHLLEKPSISQKGNTENALNAAGESKRAIKKRRLAARRERRKRKRETTGAQDEENTQPLKRKRSSHSTNRAKASSPRVEQ